MRILGIYMDNSPGEPLTIFYNSVQIQYATCATYLRSIQRQENTTFADTDASTQSEFNSTTNSARVCWRYVRRQTGGTEVEQRTMRHMGRQPSSPYVVHL